jgi:archaellum biogenesis ATPase FlaH
MLDNQILAAAIASREAYDKLEKHLSFKEFSPHVGFWWKALAAYYGRDKRASSADRAVLLELGQSGITNPKHRDAILGALPESSDGVSVPNVIAAALSLLRTNRAAEFASAALGGDTKKAAKLLEEVNDLYGKEDFEEESEIIVASPIEDLFQKVGSEQRIPILPAALNVRVGGGVLPGHHILVFGRTEIGKSAFVINLVAGFIKQKQRVLFIGNEDEINNVKARFVCRITGSTMQQVEADKEDHIALYKQRGAEELLRLVHMQPGTIAEVEKEIKDFLPSVVVLDQIRNLSSDEDGITKRIEQNAIGFRSLLSRYSLVGVSVTQASDKSERNSADLPVWLSAGDVDSSRVGLPGTADLMIGIGGNQEMISRGQRALSICKNKLHSGPQSREGLIVSVDLARSLVT